MCQLRFGMSHIWRITATPLLPYVVGLSPHLAIGTNALAVSANPFVNLGPAARALAEFLASREGGNIFAKWELSMGRIVKTLLVMALAGGVAYQMAAQPASIMSAASAASLPPEIVEQISRDPYAPVTGNPVGSVTVVEFFDYRCPFCRTMEPTLDALVAKDKRVRLVFKEWPIFGGASVTAARIALAASWQGKYAAVHQALFKLPRTMDEPSIRQAAATAGVDLARLDHDLATRGKELDVALARVDGEARAIGFQGTPGVLVGALVAPGAIPAHELDTMVERAAKK
jgi:protein-disulfide isomerase